MENLGRVTEKIQLPIHSVGTQQHLLIHTYKGEQESGQCYIQASLHADESPGLLVCHHLLKMIDTGIQEGKLRVLKSIVIVPFANPIGLGQYLMGCHLGRFAMDTGINFNRNWLNLVKEVAADITNILDEHDENKNVKIVREALIRAASKCVPKRQEDCLKLELYKRACISDIVLDLHCDSVAALHLYTHTRLWPAMEDLASDLNATCTLLAGSSGGNPFDEAMSCPWAELSDLFPKTPIPMACQSVTVELRGERDVDDKLAQQDAEGIFRFLHRRGFLAVASNTSTSFMDLPTIGSALGLPLTGVDMIEAPKAGLIVWCSHLGQQVEVGDLLAQIVDLENPWEARVSICSNQKGVIFARKSFHYVKPGDVVLKVAGAVPLEYREGKDLLTL